MTCRELAPRTARRLALVLLALPGAAMAHGLIVDPPARNAFCGYITKPDQVNNGTAQYPVCGGAFNATGLDPNIGYNFMAVLTHDQGYAVVGARDNVCGFDAEPFGGKATPWDQPIDWPTNAVAAGPITFTWNISWGPHFSDTQEFRYWITRSDFAWQVGKPLSFSDFEATNFCYLTYDDTNPSGNPNVVPDKTAATFKTKCTLPTRSGHHVIYAEWGRNYFTYERFHGCIDVVFGGGTGTSYTLGVSAAGTGAGTVTSSVGGISCGATCSASLAAGTSVTLTAAAASGSTFAGWSGACSGTAATCAVSMTQARTVTATFNTSGGTSYALTVTKNGTGGGTVYSTPAGVTCGTTCSASFASGTVVTLVGDVASGSTFAGWGGGVCTGTGPCTVTMSQARAVTATFNTTTGTLYALTVTRAGAGSGTVTSTPAGISCGSTCAASFNSGTTVTLSAAAASGSTFAGWSGACTGTGSCTTTLTAAQAVTATFNGTGGGTPCANPVDFTNQSGNFNTAGAICLRTRATVNGWGCSNFQGRTVSVSGGAATSTCGAGPFPLPKASDGYTYFAVTAGTYTWASLYTW